MNIVLTTDGHDAARRAIRTAIKLLPLATAKVWVLSVTDPEVRIGANENASDDIAEAQGLLGEAGVTAEGVVRRGQFAEEIVAFAHEVAADVIVVGSTGRGLLAQWISQAVSSDVLRKWKGAVLVVGPE